MERSLVLKIFKLWRKLIRKLKNLAQRQHRPVRTFLHTTGWRQVLAGGQKCSPGQITLSACMPPDTNMKMTSRVMVLFSHPANVLSFFPCCLGLLQLPLSSITNASTVSRTQKTPQNIALAAFLTQNSL